MLWSRLNSIRGQLVLWYLAVLAVLLLALGTFQVIRLNSYLRSSTADTLRHSAFQELAVLGPCYVTSSRNLENHAGTLASLLGGHDTAVTIVTPAGQALASHDAGPPGAATPMRLSEATIRQLIGRAQPSPPAGSGAIPATQCPRAGPNWHHRPRHHDGTLPPWARSLVTRGDLVLVAVGLGPSDHPVGYAILGRSLAGANETVAQVLLVFVLGAIIAILLAALVAIPIINRALRPLRRVADTAQAIASGDMEKRVKLSGSRDEVERLGAAFDTMVDRLQEAISRSAASEERMRRFLADASHELRTPATVLRGSSQVLLKQSAGQRPEVVTALKDMHEEAVRLSRLVDDLLTLSRLDAGQPLAPEPVEVRPFLHEFVDRYASVWPNREIRIDDGSLDGATARVDPDALRRVVTNLVDNAARYSRPEGVITLSGEPGQTSVSLAIADEGPGMSQEDAQHMFDRFYRAAKSRSRNSGGTGLGLSIVRSLVEQSGGDIAIDTAPDRGTTITVKLPSAA